MLSSAQLDNRHILVGIDAKFGQPGVRADVLDGAAVLRAQTASATAATIAYRPRRRRSVPLLAALAVAAALAIVVAVLALDRSPSPAPPPRVVPVARSTDAARQARNLIAWINRYSAP